MYAWMSPMKRSKGFQTSSPSGETKMGSSETMTAIMRPPENKLPKRRKVKVMGFVISSITLMGVSGEILPAPTSDVNLPLAMALFVITWAHIEAFRARGFTGYFKHYTQPYVALTPINIVEEITKPITLTFRLFGNLFSGGLMIVVVAALAPIALGPFEIIWKPFDLFIGLIQAFIFMLLTIMYFGMAMAHDPEHDIEHAPIDDAVLQTSQ